MRRDLCCCTLTQCVPFKPPYPPRRLNKHSNHTTMHAQPKRTDGHLGRCQSDGGLQEQSDRGDIDAGGSACPPEAAA
eukprot:6178041-Pleurochrysis_carterae.AAC.1